MSETTFADDYIDQINIICEDFGCEAGADRLAWLHEELSKVARLTARIEELEKALAPFAKFVETDVTKQVPDGCVIVIPNRNVANFIYGDLRFARSTLEASDRNGRQK